MLVQDRVSFIWSVLRNLLLSAESETHGPRRKITNDSYGLEKRMVIVQTQFKYTFGVHKCSAILTML